MLECLLMTKDTSAPKNLPQEKRQKDLQAALKANLLRRKKGKSVTPPTEKSD